eukprot:gene12048-biopygen10015
MRLALGSSQRPLLNTPPSRVAVSEDAEDNAYPPLSPVQRPSATPSQPPVHSPLQEFITPRETFTGATATQAAGPPHMTTNTLFSSEEEVESPSKRLAHTPRQLPEPSPANQLPASQPSGNGSSSSSDNSGSHPSQSPHGPGGNPGGDPASSSDSDGVPDDEADTGGPPDQPGGQPPSPPDSDDEPPPPPEEDEGPPPPDFQGDVSDADSNDSERHVALMIGVGSVLSWQLPTEGSQLHGGSVSHTKAWLLMMKSYIFNIKRDLAVEELWEQMMVQVYENSQPFVLFTNNRAAWIQECNALQTQSSLNGVLQINEHGQPIMNPATWKLKLLHFYDLVKTGLALALKVTPLDAKEEYEKFDCYDNAGLLYPMPRILMSEFTKKDEEFDIRAGQPHYREAMAKVAKLLDRMAPTLKENFGSYKDRPTVMPRQTPAFPVTQDPSAPKGKNGEPKSSTVCTTCNITGHGSDTCYLNNLGTPNPSCRGNQPLQLEAPQAAQSDLQEPDWYNAALVVSFRQTPEAETQASSQAIYKPTFNPSTDGTGSTAAIPLPRARVSQHVTQAQHRASQDLLMDEMTVLRRDLDFLFREVQNLHEFNRALQVRATAVETAQRAACVTHNPVDTFVRDYTASSQLSPSTATLLQGTEPSYSVPYLANRSHQTGLSFTSATGLLQCVNLMVLVDTGSGLNFISQSMADSLGYDPLPCHHKTIAFNDIKSSLTKEIQMPVIFCSGTPNEISVRATFVIAPDNTIFDALIGTPLMAMPGISALPDISQEKLTLRPLPPLVQRRAYCHRSRFDRGLAIQASISNQAAPSMLGRRRELGTPSPTSSTPAGDDYEEPQDFFTTQLDDVYWRPGQEFLEGQAAVYQASTSCAFPVHLDPPTPASLLPGRLQGGLTSCLSHMDPNYLQEGGINNSMPDGAVTPNADRGALHPDCDLFIGHHQDGTEAQRKEMAAMLNRMTPAVARTMEDLREGYKGIVPPMHIEKDNDKQAFTSPYRKPPIEKLAQDKVCAELLLLGFIEPAPSAQHAANPVVALKNGPDGQYTANRKVMETELGKRGLLKFSKVFIDDILVHSATFADHIKDVEAVLQCLIDIGLRIHPDKSCFALDAVDFLGFNVSNHGLTPQAAKVQAIKDLPYPSNLKDLKTILGAQHGNADALSRFPSPTAEDNTGARIDLDSDLYAAFPTVPTTPYVPLDLTLGHIVDYVLDVRSVLSICTTPLPAAVTYMAQNGITLYEMCGGMCAGLEAALRNGIQVNRQLDTDLRLAAMSKDTDGLDIHSDQFVLEYLRRGVLGSNWTTSLPVEDWFCPNCKASGITAIPAGRIPEAPQKEPNLFPTPQTRSRDRAALACDKMLVIKQVRVQGGLDKAVWGTASFQGPLSRPW